MAKTKDQKQKSFFTYIKWFWILFGSGVLVVILIFLLASWGAFGEMPTFERLENPETNLATEFISSDGKTLGKLYLDDNRTWVDYDTLNFYPNEKRDCPDFSFIYSSSEIK